MNGLSIGCVRRLHPFWSRYLHLNYHCCQLLQSDVWTLLTSLTSNSESATAPGSIISSAQKPENRLSLSESLKRSFLKTGNAFLWLDFQKLPHFCFVHKDNAKWRGGSRGSLVLLLFMGFSWNCTEISVYGNSEVYWSRPDVLGRSAHGPAPTFLDAVPGKGLSKQQKVHWLVSKAYLQWAGMWWKHYTSMRHWTRLACSLAGSVSWYTFSPVNRWIMTWHLYMQ